MTHSIHTSQRRSERRRPRPLLAAQLIEEGLTEADAAHWLDLADSRATVRREVVATARSYQSYGISAARARDWFDLAINPAEALDNESHGFLPRDVMDLRCKHHARTNPDGHTRFKPFVRIPDESEWIATRIEPHLVDLYIQAGHTATAATELEARRRAGDLTIEPALHMIAALRTQPGSGG
jgi:hypothetical protein